MAAWRVVGWRVAVKGCFRGSRRRRSNELYYYVRKLLFSSDYKWRTKVSAACEWARVIKVPLGIHNYYRITMGFNECQVEINLNWIIIRDLCGIVAIVEITREQFLILHHHPPTNEQVTTLDIGCDDDLGNNMCIHVLASNWDRGPQQKQSWKLLFGTVQHKM